MRKKRSGPRNKPWFCYDVNQEFHILIKQCNRYAKFISSVKVTGNPAAKDSFILKECNKQDLHIITHNTKHFKFPPKNIKVGIICVGLKNEDDYVPKFTKLFSKLGKHNNYYYKTINIGDSITVKDRKTCELSVL